MVFNARTRSIKWQQHLDLSTDRTAFKAYINSAPTLADINDDGKLEIIVGTSMVSGCRLCYPTARPIEDVASSFLGIDTLGDLHPQRSVQLTCSRAGLISR